MFRKSLKYITIAGVNSFFLILLYGASQDELTAALDSYGALGALFTVTVIFFLSLIGMRVLVGWINKKGQHDLLRKKVKYSILLTLIISAYFYVSYSAKVYKCLFDERRASVIAKIEPAYMLAYGTKADSLTYQEYTLLMEVTGWFPELPSSSTNISYFYTYDGFLPDYTFRLTYEVPLEEEIELIHNDNGSFDQSRSFEIVDGRKVVTYSEGRS